MEISSKNFGLNESIDLIINSNDNDGLIYIPIELQVKCEVTNNYGKIITSKIHIETIEDEISLKKNSIGDRVDQIDIKNLDRFIFKQLNDPSSLNHDPFSYFLNYDLSTFEKGRRPS